jgi:hypothetical protein
VRIVRLVVAGCLMALVTGCGAVGSPQLSAVESSANPTVSRLLASFGDRRTWANGLSITIAPPRSLTPSSTAYPQAPRAAVFEMTIDNGSGMPYKPSQLAVKATIGGQVAQELVDPAQGLGGYVAAEQDMPPGKSLTLTLAFAMPKQPAQLRIVVQPDVVDSAPTASFTGTA